MGARASTRVFERHCGVHFALMIIFHHYEPFRTDWLWFHCISTISMILTILSYKSIKFTEEVILGTLLGGTSQCNSSLEPRNFAIVARFLGNQIIGVGVRVRSISLRYTMIVMMRIQSSPMMIVTLA
jgi:hypothetical protein